MILPHLIGKELGFMTREAFEQEILRLLKEQCLRTPAMQQEDVLKFVFQAMLGVGHLISSVDDAKNRLAAEMAALEPDESEPLIEKISSYY